jgi:hypothetical protein
MISDLEKYLTNKGEMKKKQSFKERLSIEIYWQEVDQVQFQKIGYITISYQIDLVQLQPSLKICILNLKRNRIYS